MGRVPGDGGCGEYDDMYLLKDSDPGPVGYKISASIINVDCFYKNE